LAQERILVIDDDRSLIESLTAALSPPYSVRAALNGNSALAYLETERTDLIILDLMLGAEDGLELLPRLRGLTPAPILLLTGFGTRENLVRAVRSKPDDFLDKPVDLRGLRGRVASLLERSAPEADPLERVRAWIARDFHRPITGKALAHAAGLGLANLRRAFADRFGLTPRAYLEECRMRRAANLLQDTDSPIKDVAVQVGFEDPNNFSTAFKRFHGSCPETFRTQHRSDSLKTSPPSPA